MGPSDEEELAAEEGVLPGLLTLSRGTLEAEHRGHLASPPTGAVEENNGRLREKLPTGPSLCAGCFPQGLCRQPKPGAKRHHFLPCLPLSFIQQVFVELQSSRQSARNTEQEEGNKQTKPRTKSE